MSAARSIADGFSQLERNVVMYLYRERLTLEETAFATGIEVAEVERIHEEIVARVRQKLNRRSPK